MDKRKDNTAEWVPAGTFGFFSALALVFFIAGDSSVFNSFDALDHVATVDDFWLGVRVSLGGGVLLAIIYRISPSAWHPVFWKICVVVLFIGLGIFGAKTGVSMEEPYTRL